jgi:hypothetical protein
MAHHSQSYLSYLHPHLGEACEAASIGNITLNLLEGPILPNDMPVSKELSLAVPNWRAKFREIAGKIGVDLSQIQSATVNFNFARYNHHTSMDTKSEIVLSDGTKYEAEGWVPNREEPVPPHHMIPGTDIKWPKQYIDQHLTPPEKKEEKKNAMHYIDRIRNILMEDWDPIGVNEWIEARDEYDSYVHEIYSMFVNGNLTRENLVQYLMKSATDSMGLTHVSKEKAEHAANKVCEVLGLE